MSGMLLQLSGVIVDLIYWIEAMPKAGDEAVVNDFAIMPGGGFNAMFAAKQAGMATVYGGGIGRGPFAEIVRKRLDEEEIAVLQPPLDGLDQGCSTVLVDRSGERSFVAREGADGVMAIETLNSLQIESFTWTLLSGYALDYAGSRDAFSTWMIDRKPLPNLVFDPSPVAATIAPEILQAALARATWVSANRREAQVLTGETDPMRAAGRLAEGREGGALVRSGADGCELATAGRVHHVPGYPVSPIDTNGAGDTHVGSFIAAVADHADPFEAARYANAAAALSTTKRGSATAPVRAEVEQILREKQAV
ncbi:MAG: PfkB family carbohydrate kinase [Geminicoccaceae bacterium]